jgi:ribosomal protein S27E
MFLGILIGTIISIAIICGIKFFEYVRGLRREVEMARQTDALDERAGHFVQVDCRNCGKMNRIPADRVRHRPTCGACKTRLMPKRRITLYTVRNLEFDKALSAELNTAMDDYRKFWETLDEHFRRRGVRATVVVDPKDLPN